MDAPSTSSGGLEKGKGRVDPQKADELIRQNEKDKHQDPALPRIEPSAHGQGDEHPNNPLPYPHSERALDTIQAPNPRSLPSSTPSPWEIYMDIASKEDHETLDVWNKNLDILLIVVCLPLPFLNFSVLTTMVRLPCCQVF